VWEAEVEPMLAATPALQAITLLEWLQAREPERYSDSLLRTLQRRVKAWRALHGPDREVMFRQRHEPGQRGPSDFTQLTGGTITVAGTPWVHRLYPFRLAYSGWCDVTVVRGRGELPGPGGGAATGADPARGQLQVPAGGFFVVARNTDPAANGGVSGGLGFSSMSLGNTSNELLLLDDGGVEVDRVAWGAGWPITADASLELIDPAADNADPTNWTVATTQ
jgi:hypothetical protein